MTVGLSRAARSVWAKSVDEGGGWLPLWQHMDDSADVAGALFDDWLAPSVVRLLAAEFGGEVDQARTAIMFLAGVHDLGKATPAFAVQDPVLAQRMRERQLYMSFPRFPGVRVICDRRAGRDGRRPRTRRVRGRRGGLGCGGGCTSR